ncbi:MAG: hypothetical protein AABZ14_05130, partial [Candidatus Margulisiibacteriota bacterium]
MLRLIKKIGIIFIWASLLFADLPIIKIISPLEEDPIFANQELSILGELKNGRKLTVNNNNVNVLNGLFRVKFKFSESGYRELVFRAENESGWTEKRVKVISLITFPDIKGTSYEREIEVVSTLGLFSSYMGTDFYRPRTYVRRYDVARLLLLLKGVVPTAGYTNIYQFPDLPSVHWAYPYIQLALNNDLMNP